MRSGLEAFFGAPMHFSREGRQLDGSRTCPCPEGSRRVRVAETSLNYKINMPPARHDNSELVRAVRSVGGQLLLGGHIGARRVVDGYLSAVRPMHTLTVRQAVTKLVPKPLVGDFATCSPGSVADGLAAIVASDEPSIKQVKVLQAISLRIQPHHIDMMRVFRELMHAKEYSKAQLEGADSILRSSISRTARAGTNAGKKVRLSFQAAIWNKLPPPPTLQQSTGNLVYAWSITGSQTLWEARLKVGEGKVESWLKTAARFKQPTRSMYQCPVPSAGKEAAA